MTAPVHWSQVRRHDRRVRHVAMTVRNAVYLDCCSSHLRVIAAGVRLSSDAR